MYGTVRTVVWADGRGNPPSDPIMVCCRNVCDLVEVEIVVFSCSVVWCRFLLAPGNRSAV